MASKATEELEFKLAVVGPDPAGTLDRIAGLDRIGRWALSRPSSHLIHDVYWDSPDGALARKRITLRLRRIDGELRFTTKGAGRSDRGLFRRREIELPATWTNWQQVRDSLQTQGVSLRSDREELGKPAAWLERAGLTVTQDRITERRVRFALVDGERIAEVALDFTRYQFATRTAEFREVEIERLAGAPDHAREIGEALMATLPDRLEPATMGKYARAPGGLTAGPGRAPSFRRTRGGTRRSIAPRASGGRGGGRLGCVRLGRG